MLVTVLAVFGAGWKTVDLRRQDHAARGASPIRSDAVATPERPGGTPGMTRPALQASMAEEAAALGKVQADIEQLCAALGIQPDEEIASLGRYETLAAEGLQFVSAIAKMDKYYKDSNAGKNVQNGQDALAIVTGWVAKSEIIGRLEDEPAKIAKLHTAAIQSALGLDPSVQEALRAAVGQEFEKLHASQLTRSQRPEEHQLEWYRERDLRLKEAARHIEAVLPSERRKPFLVEQILHLGTGMRTSTSFNEQSKRGVVNLSYVLPGMAPFRF
jgi:hypothetical protein